MASTIPAAPDPATPLVAPRWHTAVTVLILLGISALSARTHGLPVSRTHGHVAGYLTAIAVEWAMAGFVWFGLRLRHFRLLDLIGTRWAHWTAALRDLGIAAGFLFVSNIILGLLARLLSAKPNSAVRALLPHGTPQIVAFVLLAASAGFCEEIICRGYLQRQFTVLTRSSAAGIVIQGVIFGAAHGYQGLKYMLIISVFGCLFGILAYWRRSLLPGMVAHFLQDGVIGLLAGLAMK
jgi:membrane protease YdiL (CAAX protease family)